MSKVWFARGPVGCPLTPNIMPKSTEVYKVGKSFNFFLPFLKANLEASVKKGIGTRALHSVGTGSLHGGLKDIENAQVF